MNQQQLLEKTSEICHALNQRRYQDNPLFTDIEMPCYWKTSELAFLYPSIFDMSQPLSQKFNSELTNFISVKIPAFEYITPQPIHVLNVKENYAVRDQYALNQVKIVKDKQNQNMSRVACEYLFSIHHFYIEQAYFLNPDKTHQEIAHTAQGLKIANLRSQITQHVKELTSIISHSIGYSKTTYNEIWSTIWCTVYKTYSIKDLHKIYNISGSPINYMTPTALEITNKMLKDIINECAITNPLNTTKLVNISRKHAIHAHLKLFDVKNTYSGEHLLKEKIQPQINEALYERKKFWKKYYPQSLLQR